ncbi:hypothetical protein K9K77_02655 [Candidatus Babeliales bacterium]|nr:hypothetical protein [Candidatus Babeliales bacterium]
MNDESNQLSLSYELLYLIQWFIEQEPEKFKPLIESALNNGLKHELQKINNHSVDPSMAHEMQYNVIDFLGLLESQLHEALNEQIMKRVVERKLMPAIDHIDTTECDTATVQFSVEKATSKLDRAPKENAQEVLFQELLKCWKPSKKTASN